MPVRIKAVPEGSVVPTKNVLLTIESTDPNCFWIVSYLETALLRVWYPTSVATVSWEIKQLIRGYLERTSDAVAENLPFRLHDFGARGVSSFESAMIGGMAHLVNFMGTDTISALVGAAKYYNEPMAGFSIPAAEHSTMTARGPEGECDAMEQMLDKFAKPGTLVAVVSDSYDIYNAVKNYWGGNLKQKVIDSGAIVVVRPDSGSPVDVPVECVKLLDAEFGSTINSKGFKVLNNVRVIQGDGTCKPMIDSVLRQLEELGFSAENIAFGMGGALLQKVDRDTQRWAMKCCWMEIDGKGVDIYKEPITDPGKKSKRGRLTLVKDLNTNEYISMTEDEFKMQPSNIVEVLVPIYENGKLLREDTLTEIRANSER
jgi:nicotinamide phosphoribosyltransferase